MTTGTITKWHELTENPKAMGDLYRIVPDLEKVELFSIDLNREGPTLSARLELPRFPDFPSARWHETDNTAQVELIFYGIEQFEAKAWETTMNVDVTLTKEAPLHIKVKFEDGSRKVLWSFACWGIRINKISPYMVDSSEDGSS